jgi:magnesium-transporting ATPase (P-type)
MPELIPEEDIGPYHVKEHSRKRNKTTLGKVKRFIIWVIKATIHSLIFYYVFYVVNLPDLKATYSGFEFYLVLVMYVMLWTIFTDLLTALIMAVPILLYYYWRRYTRKYKHRNYGVWLWEYIIYVLLRVLVYALMITVLVSTLLSMFISADLAFILAWLIVSLGTNFLAKILARTIASQ